MSAITSRARIVWPVLLGGVLGGLLGAALTVSGPPAPAAAHANLVGSEPANGTVLSDPPDQVVLSFSEPVRVIPDRIQVVGPDGQPAGPGAEPSAAGTEVTIPLDESPDNGTYLVSYRVISQDSHPVFGSVTYSVGAPSEVPALPAGESDTEDPLVKTLVSIDRYLGYAGVVLLVGPALALALLWPSRLPRRGAVRLLWTGVGLVAVSTVVAPWLQAAYTTGEPLTGVGVADLREVLASPYGTAHIVRLGVLVSVAVLLRPLIAGRAGRVDLLLLAGLGLVGLGTWSFAGHPIASPVPAVTVLAGTVHLAAAAVWIGGLVMLAGFLLRLADRRELSVILPEWSRWAALAVTVLLLAGLVQAVVEIGPPEAVFTTTYGRLLLAKLGLVAAVIAVASYSRRLVRRRLGESRPREMRLAVGAEAVVLAAVLVMSSVLVQTTPGRTESATDNQLVSTRDFAATLDTELYSLQVLVEPAELGDNTMHLYAYSPTGQPQLVEEWRVTAGLPAAGVEPVEVEVLPLTDNHAFGELAMPVAGEWELRFTLRVSEIDQESVGVTIPIR
ncbi:MAG: copper resistance protein CopC [Micromonosporaceae bacterium]|nr:copper resistance protein CopC [Micromonosporaceae bacterium]